MKANPAPEQGVGIFQPARRRIPGMKHDMVGQRAAQQTAIEPVGSPPHPHGSGDAAQPCPKQLRQERQHLAPSHRQPRKAAILAAYCDGPPWNTAVPATSTVAPAATARLAVADVMPPSTSSAMSRPVFC